jgi:hypothetical protein
MKNLYTAHLSDPNCPYARLGRGEECPKLANLKKDIEDEERLMGENNFSSSFGLK